MPPHLFISLARPELDGAAPIAMDAHQRAWLAASEHRVTNGKLPTRERSLIASGARHRALKEGTRPAESAGRLLVRSARAPASAHVQPPGEREQAPIETAIVTALALSDEQWRERS